MLDFITSGESHGKSVLVTISGFPAGQNVDIELINKELAKRQSGYGRGKRMSVEKDRISVLAGILNGKTTGSPVTFEIQNKLRTIESSDKKEDRIRKEVTVPRPGHADFAGYIKYGFDDIRNVIERASARETAARVAAGGLFKQFLREFGINITGHVKQIGHEKTGLDIQADKHVIETSVLRCPDPSAEQKMIKLLDETMEKGDSLGGVFTVTAEGIPCGLGSYAGFNTRIEGKIGQVMLSIPSVKGVEIGDGFANSELPGSEVHDEFILSDDKSVSRKTNNAGGIEGGITNGQNIVVNCSVKPLPTLRKPLQSVNLKSRETVTSRYERSDVCIVPSASIIGESMLAFVLCREFLEKFGSDYLEDIKNNFNEYKNRISNLII